MDFNVTFESQKQDFGVSLASESAVFELAGETQQTMTVTMDEDDASFRTEFENGAELLSTDFGEVTVIERGGVRVEIEETETGATITVRDDKGTSVAEIRNGRDGERGADGLPGRDGVDGQPGVAGEPGAPGRDGIDGKDGKDGKDGLPGEPGPAGRDGRDGQPGADGVTPHIGDNGNWWIGETDTGVPAVGSGGTGGSGATDMFAMSVDEDGNLYAHYEESGVAPAFEMDENCNLYYVIEG